MGETFSFYISPSPTHQQELLLSERPSAGSVIIFQVCVCGVCEREREIGSEGEMSGGSSIKP